VPAVIDLRSDTATRPTPAMRRAIADAVVGDEQRGEDPTVLDLQERVAALLGHEAALFLPSGSMCNLIGMRLHLGTAGDEVLLGADTHPVRFEAGSPSAVNGAVMTVLPGEGGRFTADAVRAAITDPANRYAPRTRLVVVEQPTNVHGGRVWPVSEVQEVLAVVREHGLRAHLDGARLLNASLAAGVAPAVFAEGFDTAWLDFSKGLGAPVGACLAGSAELMAEAWRLKQMFGGALRQAGIVAAAAVHALDHHVDRLADDHANARRLANGLAALDAIALDPDDVETNIVVFGVGDAAALCSGLAAHGVAMAPVAPDRVRAVTHLDVSAEDIDRAIAAVAAVMA
jgi:threonine aldolase